MNTNRTKPDAVVIERLLQLVVEVACDINNFILSKKGSLQNHIMIRF